MVNSCLRVASGLPAAARRAEPQTVARRPHRIVAARLLLAVTARRPAMLHRVLGAAARAARRDATIAEATTIHRTLTSASLRCASPYGCQPRSVALTVWCLLTRRRVSWVVGAATAPLGLHAWVEAQGRPVGESVDRHLLYQPIIVISGRETS